MSWRRWGVLTVLGLVLGPLVAARPADAAQDTDSAAPAAAGDEGLPLAGVRSTAIVLPTRVRGEASGQPPAPRLRRLARRIDALLTDAAQDLGLTVDLGEATPPPAADPAALHQLAIARHGLVIAPTVRRLAGAAEGRTIRLELSAAEPSSPVLLTRVERVAPRRASIEAVVMLRDIVRRVQASVAAPAPRVPPVHLATPASSAGRAILAVNSTIYGGFVGLSLQRASNSDDPRLLYPLLGVGAGVGLGAAIIVADEWNVGVGDAWYLAAGAWWPAVAGHLIYQGRFGDTPGATEDGPWSLGLIASTAGLTLSSVALLSRGMGDGGAALAHSGGALGLLLGGMTEFAVTGVSDELPYAGLGYGAMGGWLVASAVAVNFHPPVVPVLTTDVGLLLGGLAGASAASPLLFEDVTPTKTRGWVAATGGGMLVGGAVAWWLGRDDDPATTASNAPAHMGPIAGLDPPLPLIGLPVAAGEEPRPAMGLQLSGKLW